MWYSCTFRISESLAVNARDSTAIVDGMYRVGMYNALQQYKDLYDIILIYL